MTPDSFRYLNSLRKFVIIYPVTWRGGGYPEIVTNGDMEGGGSKNCHFCGDVVFERPLSKLNNIHLN